MLVAFSLLAVSLSFLIYRNPPSTWLDFITRLRHYATPITSSKPPPAEQEAQAQINDQIESERPSSPSPQTTPKALPQDARAAPPVPTFTLNEHENEKNNEDSDNEDDEDNLPPPSFPALNSAQRASGPAPSFSMPPPTTPNLMAPPPKAVTSSLMPPPRVAPSNLRSLPNTSQSMRVPTTGPLPNRGPVPNRAPQASNGSLALPPSGGPVVKTPNARGKVLLSPGHSPLDWANLQRSGKNLSGVDSLVRVTPAMLKEKNGRKGKPAWSSYQGKVYNISPYLPFHPGGEGELRRAAGKDGTKLFMEVHPWVNWENMLGECLVGILVSEEPAVLQDAGATTTTTTMKSLEDMD